MDGTLTAENIRRSFKLGSTFIEVLRGVSLTVSPGERVFLCGPSGAGKTTLLYILGGLESPTSGRVLISGESLYDRSNASQAELRNRSTGYIFQNYLLLPELTALENVCLPAMIGGRQAKERAAHLLDLVGLGARLQHLPSELSGGEQQRVAIARALANSPGLLLADEPTANLDHRTSDEVFALLTELVKAVGLAAMVATHNLELAGRMDRVLTITDGSLSEAPRR